MTTIKAMTFNLRGSMLEIDGVNYWPHRADLNISVLRRAAPDIIGFQEFQIGHRDSYAAHLPEYEHVIGHNTIDDSEFGMQNPIYWRRERFALRDCGAFYLSETPERWSVGWDGVFVRSVNWVRLHDTQAGFDLIALNTHLDHLGETARQHGARLIVGHLQAFAADLPVIVTGDMNSRVWAVEANGGHIPPELSEEATPPGTVHRIFTAYGLRDTFNEAGHAESADTNTFHDFKGEDYPAIGQRIDWVLIGDGAGHRLQTLDCAIIRDAQPPVYPSDHYPVMATVRVVSSG